MFGRIYQITSTNNIFCIRRLMADDPKITNKFKKQTEKKTKVCKKNSVELMKFIRIY